MCSLRLEYGNPSCFRSWARLQPFLVLQYARTGAKRTYSDLSFCRFLSEPIQHIGQDRSGEWRIQIEQGSVRKICSPGILRDEPGLSDAEGPGALPRTCYIGWLDLNSHSSTPGQYRHHQGHMPQSRSQIDQDIVVRESTGCDQVEDMARWRRLIRQHLRRSRKVWFVWLAKLKDTVHDLVSQVEAQSPIPASRFRVALRSQEPLTECARIAFPDDFKSGVLIKLSIGSFESGPECPYTGDDP